MYARMYFFYTGLIFSSEFCAYSISVAIVVFFGFMFHMHVQWNIFSSPFFFLLFFFEQTNGIKRLKKINAIGMSKREDWEKHSYSIWPIRYDNVKTKRNESSGRHQRRRLVRQVQKTAMIRRLTKSEGDKHQHPHRVLHPQHHHPQHHHHHPHPHLHRHDIANR